MGFKFLMISRFLRSIGIIFENLSSPLYLSTIVLAHPQSDNLLGYYRLHLAIFPNNGDIRQ